MSDEVKKISFGFSKLAKPKTNIISSNKEVKKDDGVQFIDCVEGKSIKIKNEEFKKPDLLVIPLPKQNLSDGKRSNLLQKILNTNVTDPENTNDESCNTSTNNVSTDNVNVKVESLDEIAAREIIEDLKKAKNTDEDKQNFTVPLTDKIPAGGKESTIDDYESIPVDKFGIAMLRGMGWAPGKGIGKTEQVVSAKQPLLRPKGLGLGADKVLKNEENSATINAPLKLIKGSFVRVIAGTHKDLFGEVIGFDDETGRLIAKMALGSNILTFNEFMVEVISKEDFHKNSKVINVKKYEEYKMKENTSEEPTKELYDSKNISDSDDHRLSYKTKQKPIRRSSDSSMDSLEDKKNLKRKHETTSRYSSSPQRNKKENSVKRLEVYKKSSYRSSSEVSPEKYSSKISKQSQSDPRKSRRHSSDRSSGEERKPDKYYKRSSNKEYNKTKKHRSSEEFSRTLKHVPRKESKRRSKSSSESSSDRHSKSKRKQYDSASDSSSYESEKEKYVSRSEYKKKCKKNKEKKKSRRRRSRSHSKERKRKEKSPKKHKSKHR